MIRSKLYALALASLMTLPLSTAGCSKGQSPTEPASFDEESSAISASSVTSVSDESKGRGRGGKRGGKDDGKDDDNNRRRGRGRGGNGGNGGNGGGNGGGGNDDDGNRQRQGREFEGAVTSVNGDSVTISGGTRILVNGSTQWSGRGDLFSLSEIQGSLSAGRNPRVEGRGTRQSDGSILAQTIKAEHQGD